MNDTKNSLDGTLDRIEEAARTSEALSAWPSGFSRRTWRDDVLALVEVAKAARGVMTQMDYETPHHTRLAAALARLEDNQ